MNIAAVLEGLRAERNLLDQAILSIETLALARLQKRGRPAGWMVAARERQRDRRPGNTQPSLEQTQGAIARRTAGAA